MEAEEEQYGLLSMFHACDVNNSGRIEKEDFLKVCSELLVHPAEVEAIFSRLDADRDGSVNFEEFSRGFQRVSALLARAWDAFQQRLGDQARFIPRNEQAAILYQNISLTEPRMVPQYERVIMNFIREVKLQNSEMENLALAVKRAQDKAAMQLSEMEEEMDQRIQAAETSTRQQVKNSLIPCTYLPTCTSCCYCFLLKLLLKEIYLFTLSVIYLFPQENQRLKKELMESQTNIAFLQSELDTLKSDFTDQSINCEREEALMRGYTDERDNLERQIEMLQSANRKLHDSNDGLRTALENSFSKYNKSLRAHNTSPGSTISRTSPKFGTCHSPCFDRSSRSSYQDEDCDSLALCDPMRRPSCESCFDSGLSTLRDCNSYDSEADVRLQKSFQQPAETAESIAGDASDADVPDIPEEVAFSGGSALDWKPSNPVSRSSSGASTRKCLPAISTQDDVTLKYPTSDKSYKIVLAGDAAVGKSSFLLRLCKNEFRGNTSATLGVDFQMKTLVVDGEPTVLQLWDTAGQERFRSIAKSYFRRADGVLLLYDVTCEKSFLNVREWVDMIEDVSQEDIPIMLVGNKVDLRKQALEEGIKCIPSSYGEKLAMTYNAMFCETSAKDGSNVIEAVLHLAREVTKQIHEDEDHDSVTSLSGINSKKLSNMNCCTA
uniref:RAS and EF-hand domain containing n=1 Tax=Scleropages formosus TaxID=113540 RepID=A0A8C9TFX6_SCLFO